MGDHNELCNVKLGLSLGLSLGLGFGDEFVPKKMQKLNNNISSPKFSFNLIPKEELLAINNNNETSQDSSFNNNFGSETDHIRKKLRLSKDQSTLLEKSFKLHPTLNQSQKQALAQQLNLKTRQVEVWFQNRRARTKSKQTEVDCEFLKKYCEKLNDENRRLKKELHELRSMKHGASQLYIQLPTAATLTVCPSCDKITRTAAVSAAVEPNSPADIII